MYKSKDIGDDLKDVIDTIDELKRAIQQQSKVRINLEAEKSAYARRLSEALAAERRQRRRAASSRVIAKRAQAATQPVIASHKEIVSLKREMAIQKKDFQDEKKTLEDKISALQLEITRMKEEREAILAAAAFAKEDADATFRPAQKATRVTSTTVPRTEPLAITMPAAPSVPVPWPYPSSPHPNLLSPEPRSGTGNSLWTGTGQLTWNPPPVNLAAKTIDRRTQPHHRLSIRRPVPPPPARPQYQPLAGFLTASQLMAPHREEENEISNSQVSQSGVDNNNQEYQTSEAEDDCVIIGGSEFAVKEDRSEEETTADNLSKVPIKIEQEDNSTKTARNVEEIGLTVPEEPPQMIESTGITEISDSMKTPLKRPKKKRRMYMNPSHDDDFFL